MTDERKCLLRNDRLPWNDPPTFFCTANGALMLGLLNGRLCSKSAFADVVVVFVFVSVCFCSTYKRHGGLFVSPPLVSRFLLDLPRSFF